jgi:hypothetical protein
LEVLFTCFWEFILLTWIWRHSVCILWRLEHSANLRWIA